MCDYSQQLQTFLKKNEETELDNVCGKERSGRSHHLHLNPVS